LDENNVHLPQNYKKSNTVDFIETPDNKISLGWFRELSELERERLRVYLSKNVQEDSVCYELMRLA
jgi:4-alpha-glucanotransferase